LTGLKAYLHHFRPAAAEWKSLRLTLNPDFQASSQGKLGWAAFTCQFEITAKGGEVIEAAARRATALERRGGRWLIVHEHSSVPWGDQK
jgi:ketosteroid isomerase-like protein